MSGLIKPILKRGWSATFGRLDGQYIRELNRLVGPDCESLLDVGCGFNSPVQHLRARPPRLVGVDGFAPVIEESRRKGFHDEYHHSSLLEIARRFGPGSFDCVLASDVIEHFEVDEALELIRQLETVARRRVILYTPNGFLPQGEEYGNPFQRHRSGWSAARMRAMGYSVTGVEGWRPLRGEMARIVWRPARFWLIVSLLSQPLVRSRPGWAFRIVCSKDLPASRPSPGE